MLTINKATVWFNIRKNIFLIQSRGESTAKESNRKQGEL